MTPHWSGYVARDGHYPDPDSKRCFEDEQEAVDYLFKMLSDHEDQETQRSPLAMSDDGYWERSEEYGAGYDELGHRMEDMTRGDKDPGDWIGMGPAVLVRGIDYVLEGCNGEDCTVQAASVDA